MKQKIGFIGLGTMGFPICYGLHKAGYTMVLPTYRKKRDENAHFIPLAPDKETKQRLYEEMLSEGCESAETQGQLFAASDVIMISMPTYKQVEMLMYGEEGVLANAKQGTIIIDLTSSDAVVSRKLNELCEEKGMEFLDCPISGGYQGATAQTLSVMIGGKKEAYQEVQDILETIGNKEKVVYLGPSGAGDVMKCANNFLSSTCLMATTEALCVLEKSGINIETAIDMIAKSGGSSTAVTFKYPELLLKNNPMGMSVDMILKDVGLFNAAARSANVPAYYGSTSYQLLGMPSFAGRGEKDWGECVRQYEDWCNVKLTGCINEKDINS